MEAKECVCVFDCETIPDVELLKKTASNEILKSCEKDGKIDKKALSQAAQDAQEKANGSGFLPVCFHEVVTISCVMCSQFGEFSRVTTIKGENECEKISKFLDYIDRFNPRLISFNGRGFDLPMLMTRAMKYNLSVPGYFSMDRERGKDKWTNYRSRYDGIFHLDLLDHIGEFGSVRGFKLDVLCASIGLPGKYDIHGDQVLELFYSNKQDKIDEYCESDVLNTYWLFLKYELLKGNLNLNDYANNLNLMSEFIKNNKSEMSYTPVFCEFIRGEIENLKERL